MIRIVTGRRAKWAVVAFWLVVAGVAGLFGARLEAALDNEQSGFLPEGAQSAEVLELEERFVAEEEAPAVVVYRREGGLAPADLGKAEEDRRAIGAAGLEGIRTPSPPIPSEDGEAVLFVVPVVAEGDN